MKTAYYKIYDNNAHGVLVASFTNDTETAEYLHQFPQCFAVAVPVNSIH